MIKAVKFKTKSTRGYPCKTVVAVDDEGKVIIEQLFLQPKDTFTPKVEVCLREFKGLVLTSRGVYLKRESMGMVMLLLSELVKETKLDEKFPESFTDATYDKLKKGAGQYPPPKNQIK